MTFDLHLHTSYSDGTWTPKQLVEYAKRLALKCIAITDHDTTDGITEGQKAAAGDLSIIPAVEINAVYEHHGEKLDVHVLGYFIEPETLLLRQTLRRQQEARLQHVLDTIGVVAEDGIEIDFDFVKSFASGGTVGRPHITQAIVAAGGAADLTQAYERYMTRGSPFYIERHSVAPQEAIAAIVDAGGIASVAHPGAILTNRAADDQLPDRLQTLLVSLKKDHGLGAVEVYHRMHSQPLVAALLAFAQKHDLAVTGGSDCHGPFADYEPTVGSIKMPESVLQELLRVGGKRPTKTKA